MYTRDIVILANSKKYLGHCIAGKDLKTGEWVRPVAPPSVRTVSTFLDNDLRRLYGNPLGPKLLDCVHIEFENSCPCFYQPENEYIHWGSRWEKIGVLPKNRLSEFEDVPPFEWIGTKSRADLINLETAINTGPFCGLGIDYQTDRIPSGAILKNPLKSSLVMLRLSQTSHKLMFEERKYQDNGHSRVSPRFIFEFDGVNYDLSITDLKYNELIEKYGKVKILEDCYIIIGIGEKYDLTQSHHKLVVGIIPTFILEDF